MKDTVDESRLRRRSWIFQANPQYFDLIEALKHIRVFRWRVNQFKQEINAGDNVFLWLAGADGGIVARGMVLTDPQVLAEAPEESPFVKEQEQEEEKLAVAIQIDTVFDKPVQRKALKSHSVLSSIALLNQSRGTNFALTDVQTKALNVLCPQAKIHGVSLAEAFTRFRAKKFDQFQVNLRRKRAEQLRSLLAYPDDIDLDVFNREVWQFESATVLDGEDIRGKVFDLKPPPPEFVTRVAEALQAGSLEMHGNYIWRMASSLYGTRLPNATDDEKLANMRTALAILSDSTVMPMEKAEKIADVAGFGPTSATGLVMVFHPQDFAIWDKQSIGAFSRLHLPASDLNEFQDNAALLKTQLGASDYLELDWFLYQINQGMIEISDRDLAEKMLSEIDDQIQANIQISKTIGPTEKKQLVKARVGQEAFRQNIQQMESGCRVSGVKDPRFLVASHIKPWRACNNEERLDGANGLILSPNIDRLFDRGYVSFGDDGTLLVAPGLDTKTLELLGVPLKETKCGEFSAKQRRYLAYHRQNVFLGTHGNAE
jgi:predicted restriction endonuclease